MNENEFAKYEEYVHCQFSEGCHSIKEIREDLISRGVAEEDMMKLTASLPEKNRLFFRIGVSLFFVMFFTGLFFGGIMLYHFIFGGHQMPYIYLKIMMFSFMIAGVGGWGLKNTIWNYRKRMRD